VQPNSGDINALSIDVPKLSDPAVLTDLPFPFAGLIQSDGHKRFKFCRRHTFETLYQPFKHMNLEQDRRLHFHGSLGAGKSYLIAAMVCLLKKEDRTVIYIPDCYELLLSELPSLYVLEALSLTFNTGPNLGSEIRKLAHMAVNQYTDLDRQVTAFCNRVSNLGITITFVVHQANVLDHDVHLGDGISNQKKMEVRKLLDGIASKHMKISSSTANYRAAMHDELRETAESRLVLNHGLHDVSRRAAPMEGP